MPDMEAPSPEQSNLADPAPEADLSVSAETPPDLERTQAVAPPSSPGPTEPRESTEDQERRLAAELARRGVPPEEIERLLTLGQPATPTPKAVPVPTPPAIPPSEPFTPHPTIELPEFRESSAQERIEADRLLTRANVARRRGDYKEAELRCREAIELAPKDAAALELYGDVLQAIGRVDDAVTAYDHAHAADPNRASAERKYAELTLAQNREIDLLKDEYIPRNAYVAVLFSAVLPGAGQMYNGEPLKGLITAVIMLVCLLLLFWTDLGKPATHTGSFAAILTIIGIAYIYAVADANVSARRGKRPKSGWEV